MKRRLVAAGSAGLSAVAALAIPAGCAAGTTGAVTGPPPTAPLATAVITSDGTWATVPVGEGGSPSDRFWQLLYRAAGSGTWVDDVSATATATNGGLDLAATGSGVVVGVQTSQNLSFSPVIETGTAGASWEDGLLPGALADTPQALAAAGHGPKTAILGQPGPDQEVVSTESDISRWTRTTTARDLSSAVPACGMAALRAAAYIGSDLLVGGACSKPGSVGLVVLSPGRAPVGIGPTVPGHAITSVVSLSTGPGFTSALVEMTQQGRLSFVAASSALGGWSVSQPLELAQAEQLVSVTAHAGHFEVLTGLAGRKALYSFEPGAAGWKTGPPPPADTATVASLDPGGLCALTTSGTTIVSWDLPDGGATWNRGQTLQIPVLYGSTS